MQLFVSWSYLILMQCNAGSIWWSGSHESPSNLQKDQRINAHQFQWNLSSCSQTIRYTILFSWLAHAPQPVSKKPWNSRVKLFRFQDSSVGFHRTECWCQWRWCQSLELNFGVDLGRRWRKLVIWSFSLSN